MTSRKTWTKSWNTPRRPDFTVVSTGGDRIDSWSVAMSFGFIIQVMVEPSKLRNLNRFMEQKAWGAFRYEVYPSYDFISIAERLKKEHS